MKIITIFALILLSVTARSVINSKLPSFRDSDSEVELYMQNFIEEGFGMQIPTIDCEHDSELVKSLIKQAMNMIDDGFDYIGIFESIQFVI